MAPTLVTHSLTDNLTEQMGTKMPQAMNGMFCKHGGVGKISTGWPMGLCRVGPCLYQPWASACLAHILDIITTLVNAPDHMENLVAGRYIDLSCISNNKPIPKLWASMQGQSLF